MWKLGESRRRFFVDCRRPEENFWATLFREAGREDLVSGDEYAEYFAITPNHSNCPEIEQAVKYLVDIAPVEWKATMRNIFVARAFNGEANAEASSFRSAGIIELNYGFTLAAMIYSTLFSHFYDAVLTVGTEVDFDDEDSETTLLIVEEVERMAFEPIAATDEAIGEWAAARHVQAMHVSQTQLPARRNKEDYHNLVTSVEQFVIAHEFCHHMLGHTDVQFRHSRGVRRLVLEKMEGLGIEDLLQEMNPHQIRELEADVGAFLLLSGYLTSEVKRSRIYRSVGGSFVALVALAHVAEGWASREGEEGDPQTHPDFSTRLEVMYRLVKDMTLGMPVADFGDHPMGFVIQLRAFAFVVLKTWASRSNADVQAPRFLNVFSWMLDQQQEFWDEYLGELLPE
ncbi:hypothetical protein ACFRNJ_17295 [Streptomyces sp. NPDC056721]|uniref:hypothetical protein n=1 Tax=Streptomyces sp. NPDC056721 TaxID=3345923 RepID=UPI0036B341CB